MNFVQISRSVRLRLSIVPRESRPLPIQKPLMARTRIDHIGCDLTNLQLSRLCVSQNGSRPSGDRQPGAAASAARVRSCVSFWAPSDFGLELIHATEYANRCPSPAKLLIRLHVV